VADEVAADAAAVRLRRSSAPPEPPEEG
jgi:hypothetical protein